MIYNAERTRMIRFRDHWQLWQRADDALHYRGRATDESHARAWLNHEPSLWRVK